MFPDYLSLEDDNDDDLESTSDLQGKISSLPEKQGAGRETRRLYTFYTSIR